MLVLQLGDLGVRLGRGRAARRRVAGEGDAAGGQGQHQDEGQDAAVAGQGAGDGVAFSVWKLVDGDSASNGAEKRKEIKEALSPSNRRPLSSQKNSLSKAAHVVFVAAVAGAVASLGQHCGIGKRRKRKNSTRAHKSSNQPQTAVSPNQTEAVGGCRDTGHASVAQSGGGTGRNAGAGGGGGTPQQGEAFGRAENKVVAADAKRFKRQLKASVCACAAVRGRQRSGAPVAGVCSAESRE